jgi:hypothetical protein
MTTAAEARTVIFLKEGHVVGMMLPLHPEIEARWRNGHLARVHEDGSPWQDSDGDPFAVLPAVAPEGDGTNHIAERSPNDDDQHPSEPGQPPRPKGNAPRPEWAAYAVALGLVTQDAADKLTRAELRELVTPPEMRPPDPDLP